MKTWNKIAFAMLVLALVVVATAEEKKVEEDAEALKKHRKMVSPPSHCAPDKVPAGGNPDDYYWCSGACVNVKNSTYHCGKCGHHCHYYGGVAPTCVNGTCIHP